MSIEDTTSENDSEHVLMNNGTTDEGKIYTVIITAVCLNLAVTVALTTYICINHKRRHSIEIAEEQMNK